MIFSYEFVWIFPLIFFQNFPAEECRRKDPVKYAAVDETRFQNVCAGHFAMLPCTKLCCMMLVAVRRKHVEYCCCSWRAFLRYGSDIVVNASASTRSRCWRCAVDSTRWKRRCRSCAGRWPIWRQRSGARRRTAARKWRARRTWWHDFVRTWLR